MSAKDAADLTDEAAVRALKNGKAFRSKGVVPVPTPRDGTGNHALAQFREPSGTAGTTVPVFETMADFLARTKDLPPMTWLLEGLVPDVGQVWLIAAGGSGKTWFAFIVAKTAAGAGRDVFIIEEEHAERGLHDRLVAMDFSPEAQERVRLLHRAGLKVGDERFRMLVEVVGAAERPVVIIDCLAQVMHGNENETKDANAFNEHMKRLMTAHPQALVVVLHHTSKNSERAETNLAMAGRGSSAFNGAADVELRQRRVPTEPGSGLLKFTLEPTKARDFEVGGAKRLTLRLGTGEVEVEDVTMEASDARVRRVLEVISDAPEPLTKTGIRTIAKLRNCDAGKLVDELVAKGTLRKEGKRFALAKAAGEGDS